MRVFLRTTGAMPPVVNAVRSVVHEIDPQQPVASIQTLEQVRGAQLAEPRLTASLLVVFSIVALILTATGLAGVIGYGVTQRLPEIAIRVALGASASRVLLLVMRQGLTIVVIGLAVGLAAALEGSGLVTKLLFHVAPTDALTYVGVGLVILATATIACFLPSRRALRADPARVFRAGAA
jgi:ABC-type antimicrobial peptide transport system permease subunit